MSEEQKKRISEGHRGQKNVMKGKHHSEESRRHMSEAHKGQVAWNKGLTKEDSRVRAYSLAHKGKKLSEEQKIRISEATKRAMSNPEIRKKISEGLKGKPSHMKGKHPSLETIEKQRASIKKTTSNLEYRKRMSEAFKKAWANPELRRRQSLSHKGQISYWKGKHFSEEAKIKMSSSHKGKPSARKGTHVSEESRKRISEATKRVMANPEIKEKWRKANIKRYLNPISLEKIKETSRRTLLGLYESGAFPKQENTLPERQVKVELTKRGYKEGMDFIHQYKFMNKFMCDFCFPKQKVIVEVYGDFWHANPQKYAGKKLHAHQLKDIARDKSKKAYIETVDSRSWTYLVLWESDIKKDVAKCVNRIEESLAKKNN